MCSAASPLRHAPSKKYDEMRNWARPSRCESHDAWMCRDGYGAIRAGGLPVRASVGIVSVQGRPGLPADHLEQLEAVAEVRHVATGGARLSRQRRCAISLAWR